MYAHLQFLEQRLASLTHLSLQFEYYSAIHLTKQFQTRFYAYQDIPESHKKYAGFPISDKGIDLIDETFQTIVQVKYYKKNGKIYYGNLSAFLASPILVGRKDLRLTLVRTNHSWLHPEIQNIIKRGDMKDITLCPNQFLETLKRYD
jgi:hypothetical protein